MQIIMSRMVDEFHLDLNVSRLPDQDTGSLAGRS